MTFLVELVDQILKKKWQEGAKICLKAGLKLKFFRTELMSQRCSTIGVKVRNMKMDFNTGGT